MIYYGAAHYYFWQGIKAGVGNKLENLYDHSETEPLFEGESFQSFANAFIDGIFGA